MILHKPTMTAKTVATRGTPIFLVLLLSAGIILLSDRIESLGIVGYPLVFITSLIGSAALFFPAPNIALILAFGDVLNPFALGLAAGSGAALGEITGYLVGYSSKQILQQKTHFHLFESWMMKARLLKLFSLALIPNPIADLGGIAAGTMKIPVWQFLVVTWAGKTVRFTALIFFAALS